MEFYKFEFGSKFYNEFSYTNTKEGRVKAAALWDTAENLNFIFLVYESMENPISSHLRSSLSVGTIILYFLNVRAKRFLWTDGYAVAKSIKQQYLANPY